MGIGMFPRLSLTVVLVSLLPGGLQAQPQMDEYSVKAAFLYNFTRFVEWPPEAFRSPSEPFSICVVGEDPFGHRLDDLAAGNAIGGRSITVRRVADARQAGDCHMVFVSSKADKRILSSWEAAKPHGVLTVVDSGRRTSLGMIITFIIEDGKVRFEIDSAATDRSGLHISAKLLSLAHAAKR